MDEAQKALALQIVRLAKDGDETYKEEFNEEFLRQLGLNTLTLDLLIVLAKNPDAGRYGGLSN